MFSRGMTLRGGEKIAGKWAHLKAAEEEGREDTARLRVSGERGDDEEAERKSGRQATFFSLCESKRPFFFCRGKLERGERSTNATKEYKSDVVVLTTE